MGSGRLSRRDFLVQPRLQQTSTQLVFVIASVVESDDGGFPPAIIGEIGLILWLLIMGARPPEQRHRPRFDKALPPF